MIDLFTAEAQEVALRPYQLAAVERVRQYVRQGKKNIILCAPTGSGKTVIGSHLINESQRKMRKSVFVVDRVTLINQTSETFDRYGIDHGVVQADHPRRIPHRRVQICSAQTVARRKWPDAELIVVDEAHTVQKVVVDRIQARDTVTIGLTATPFTRGLGKIYDALVNVTTTAKLIEDGFLAPYRIFAAVEPDMTGVRVVAGEWVESEASKKALEVVGDVVAEYVKHGESRKFICSSCDVAHAEELAQWDAADANFKNYTDQISRLERWNEINTEERGVNAVEQTINAMPRDAREIVKSPEYHTAFMKALAKRDLTSNEQSMLREMRGTATITTAETGLAGGYVIPYQFSYELEKTMAYYGPMLNVSRIITTPQAGTLYWPKVNDTATAGSWHTEGGAVTVQDMTFTRETFSAHVLNTLVKVSVEWANDEFGLLNTELPIMLGERLGRGLNTAFTTGDGSGKPTVEPPPVVVAMATTSI